MFLESFQEKDAEGERKHLGDDDRIPDAFRTEDDGKQEYAAKLEDQRAGESRVT